MFLNNNKIVKIVFHYKNMKFRRNSNKKDVYIHDSNLFLNIYKKKKYV